MADTGDGPSAVIERSPAADVIDRRQVRRRALGSIVRVALVTVVLSILYVVAPIDEQLDDGSAVMQMILALLVVAVVVGLQIVAVARSPYPRLRAVEAVAVSVPLLIFLFAGAYVVMASSDDSSFTEPLNRIDSIYFTVTVFATVGFGDISATSDAARVLVTIQMVADLVLIGLIAKVLLQTVQQRRQRLATSHHGGDSAAEVPRRENP